MRFFIFFAVLALCFVSPARAWGPAGHQLIADIASARLAHHAKQEVARLLQDDLDANGQLSGRKTLASISTWADDYRRVPAGQSTGPWHYDNREVCESAESHVERCPDGACASRALEREIHILADQSAAPRQRNEALKWVVHLVGDIHQPLHETENNDRGGNLVHVKFFGITEDVYGPLNLHGVWDTQIVDKLLAQTRGAKSVQSEWESGSIASWIAESHELGVRVTYGKLPKPLQCGQPPTEALELGEDYYAAAAPVVDMQLRKAGVRLAKILNDALRLTPVSSRGNPSMEPTN
jgi:hypothetical protein